MSKVVIGIPCYNSEDKIKRLLDSIMIQKYKDFDVIITDDSDNNHIENMLNDYAILNILYYKNVERLGIAGNTNQVLKIAMGRCAEYLKIMYHDDWFSSSESLEKMVKALEDNKKAGLAFSRTYEVEGEIKFERKITKEQIVQLKKNFFILTYFNIIGAPSSTIIRVNDLFMDKELMWFVDIDWYIQILQKYGEFVFIDEPLINIGIGETQVTCNCIDDPILILNENVHLYKKYQELRCENYMNKMLEQIERIVLQSRLLQMKSEDEDIYVYGAGRLGKRCAKFLNKNHIIYKAFIVSYRKIYEEIFEGHKIIEFKDYLAIKKNKKSVIILALSEINRAEVIADIENAKVDYIIWK